MKLPHINRSEWAAGREDPEMSPDEFSNHIARSRAEAEEIVATAEADLRTLNETNWSLKYTSFILAAAIVLNLGLLVVFTGEYFLSWIMASFIFLMVNPFLLMLPTDVGELRSYMGYLRDLKDRERKSRDEIESNGGSGRSGINIADKTELIKGLSRQRSALYELGWNLFFINCQPLAPGFLVLFALSSVFAFAGWMVNGEFEAYSSIIVIIQSVAIIAFYSAIVYVQPYSRGFFSGVLGMHSRFKERYEEAWSQGLKYALTAVVLVTVAGIAFIGAIVLPGMTYNSFIAVEGDFKIGAGTFAFVFLTQMVIVRYLQGKYGRALVYSLLNSKIEAVRNDVLPAVASLGSESLSGGVTPRMADDLKKINLDIIRHKVLKIDYVSLFGYFPVCIVNPDVGVIMSLSERMDGRSGRSTAGETPA